MSSLSVALSALALAAMVFLAWRLPWGLSNPFPQPRFRSPSYFAVALFSFAAAVAASVLLFAGGSEFRYVYTSGYEYLWSWGALGAALISLALSVLAILLTFLLRTKRDASDDNPWGSSDSTR